MISLSVPAALKYRDVATRVVSAACKLVGAGAPSSPPGTLSRSDFHEHVISAFGEAFNNVVIHAYKGSDDASGDLVTIEVEVLPAGIEIRLLDHGASFDHSLIPEPDLDGLPESGMGLFIMRSFMDEVVYEPGSPNVLRIAKCL